MALESWIARTPSSALATVLPPRSRCAANAFSTPMCCGFWPSVFSTCIITSGRYQGLSLPKQIFRSFSFSFQHRTMPSSHTSLPISQSISSRFVPGRSPVEATKVPVAPFSNARYTLTSSSTSIRCHFPSWHTARTSVGMPHSQISRSS